MDIVERFIEKCWLPFVAFFHDSGPYSLADGDGTPSRLVRSEEDAVLQVALHAAAQFGAGWIHLESPVPGGRLDLVVTNPEPLQMQARLAQPRYDLAAEFKIVVSNDDRHRQYGLSGVESDVRKLTGLMRQGLVTHGVVCVIDKIGPRHEEAYRDLEREGVRVLRCYDA